MACRINAANGRTSIAKIPTHARNHSGINHRYRHDAVTIASKTLYGVIKPSSNDWGFFDVDDFSYRISAAQITHNSKSWIVIRIKYFESMA